MQVSLDAEDIRNEKVKVLRSMRKVTLDDVVLGQYRGRCVGKGWAGTGEENKHRSHHSQTQVVLPAVPMAY